ncbi:peptide chain release factor N(5)-glutamine methyltransferase [Sphingomonas sp.]|jgi:release factor glutamine methyltransferase|uniref:peptide chain release factor N(5)-glutamine methyltransferase n=1 Tax=Sphingomonas sp. TaxID=28214 RepID=UPI002DE20C9C|nr:peptide chain release factor N(5)-glutamine methyltransferase [Sphingomonas sp.]HEV2567175.1 peptide chain release factor N(5)-glutamine methyltransferase [Sphingomonas sp.]
MTKGSASGEVLRRAAERLTSTSSTPRLDAELLLAHALGVSREALLLRLDSEVPAAFEALLQRRLAHEPVAYITGTRSFWTLDLHVTPAVLIPRPDSETLIEAAIAHFDSAGPATVLDLGTGSGALLLAALDQWPGAWGLGVDRSRAAIDLARGNAERLRFGGRARFVKGSWGDALDGQFDLILCNPPYVEDGAELAPDVAEYEPGSALFAGPEGLDDYRVLAPQLARLLAPGGLVALEIGSTQRESVSALMQVEEFSVRCRQDLAGRDRCLELRRD